MFIQQVSTEHIAIDPDYCCGKPRIVGMRMPVATIAQMYLEMGESLLIVHGRQDNQQCSPKAFGEGYINSPYRNLDY